MTLHTSYLTYSSHLPSLLPCATLYCISSLHIASINQSSRSPPRSALAISQPPPTALASAPLIPFISCADRCTVLGSQRIRLPAHYLDYCVVAHHTTTTSPPPHLALHTRPPPTTTAPARPRAIMGSYTFRWYVISAPPSLHVHGKGKDVSSAMEPRRASELGSSWRWWSCRLASPAGCSVVQCYLLRYRQPTHAQIFTPIRPFSIRHTSLSSQPAC